MMIEKYADMHCHILPGVDDGAPEMEISLKMLQMEYEQGARKILLTPHYEPGRNPYEPEELDTKFEELKRKAKELFHGLELFLGNELLFEPGAPELVREGNVHSLNQTKYLLVEFNIQIHYQELYQAMRALQKVRLRPVIAHVERYRCLTKNPGRIHELQEMGIYLQMNADSVLGSIFDENTRWCRRLLKEKSITLLGTDAHNLHSRAPQMKKALEWMEKHLDIEYVKNITWNYPVRMLENQYPEI